MPSSAILFCRAARTACHPAPAHLVEASWILCSRCRKTSVFPAYRNISLPLLASDSGLLVERIVSWGHVTPEGQWCDQEKDEWVLLLEGSARLGFADGREVALERGRYLLLPRHVRHRVLETSKPCIWLAIHAPQLRPQETGGTAGGPQGQDGPRPRFPQRHGQR